MKQRKEYLWGKAVSFHGHVCAGLAIGFKAALYAAELLGVGFSENEQLVCVSENDACGVDAIQAVLGCSIGKGNLLFHMRGKQAFSFYDRKTRQSVRLALNPVEQEPDSMEERVEYYMSEEPENLFRTTPVRINLPETARLFEAYDCECCGEKTAANWIRISGGKKVCLDCYERYDRFDI